jgi:TM2 domain-containing membrane protein YozV
MLSVPMLVLLASASATQLGKGQLEDHLRTTSARLGEPYLVGAVGEKVERAVRRALDAAPGVHVDLTRMPTIGDADAEMARALAEAGLRCGLYIAESSSGGWSVTNHGDCRSVQAMRAEEGGASDEPAEPAVQAPPPPAPPRPPAPASTSDAVVLWKIARLEAEAPDPAVALLESTILGFGTGHFYADKPARGWTHLGVQALGLGLSGFATWYGTTQAETTRQWNTADRLLTLGFVIYGADRVVDMYTAPISAHDTASERMKARR